jgi:hypothetical protein
MPSLILVKKALFSRVFEIEGLVRAALQDSAPGKKERETALSFTPEIGKLPATAAEDVAIKASGIDSKVLKGLTEALNDLFPGIKVRIE